MSRYRNPVIVALSLAFGVVAFAQDETVEGRKLKLDYSSGTAIGNLTEFRDMATIDKSGDTMHHLRIGEKGKSKVRLKFTLGRRPSKLVFTIYGRSEATQGVPGTAVYSIHVNDKQVEERVQFRMGTYTSIGHDIAQNCDAGENTVEVRLHELSTAALWVREFRIEGEEQPPYPLLAGLTVMLLLMCRYVWFELMWLRGRGMDAIMATRLSMILSCLLWLLGYVYLFRQLHPTHVVFGVGVVMLIVLVGMLTRTAARA